MKKDPPLRWALIFAACCAGVFAVYGYAELFGRGTGFSDKGKFVASFACFGFLFGGIVAFDSPDRSGGSDRPLLRVVFGAVAGFIVGLLWQWPAEGVALSVIVAGILGYAGMTWAKHI
jgi:hypothetical protein